MYEKPTNHENKANTYESSANLENAEKNVPVAKVKARARAAFKAAGNGAETASIEQKKMHIMSREELKASLMSEMKQKSTTTNAMTEETKPKATATARAKVLVKPQSTAGMGMMDRVRAQASAVANLAGDKTQSVAAKPAGEKLRPADRYRVNADDYPIFRKQVQDHPDWGDHPRIQWNIDKTMSRYVTATASLIAAEDGTATFYEDGKRPKPDHVIYLDKSARPVSWMVNTFWNDFSDKPRPKHTFLNIDRLPWLRRAGLELDAAGYIENADGSTKRPNFSDFMKNVDNIPQEVFARVRALFVEGGIETDDPMEVMKMPTMLDGKNLLIVDEVQDTGVTLDIAKYVLKRAIPELESVNGEYFWNPGFKVNPDGTETQHLSVPVWYSHKTSLGRGTGDVNEPFYRERYAKYPNPKTRAQKMGALVLSEVPDLDNEDGGLSRELMREIQQMHRDYEEGKILMSYPENWDYERMEEKIAKEGLRLGPVEDKKSPDVFTNVLREIENREVR